MTCSVRSAFTGSRRSRASAARRSGTFEGPRSSIGIRKAPGSSEAQRIGGIDRYGLGLHHLALEAVSRAVVDERNDWLVGAGAEIETPPQEYAYSPGYYAVFFYDPDGIKLEIVHVPGLAA